MRERMNKLLKMENGDCRNKYYFNIKVMDNWIVKSFLSQHETKGEINDRNESARR